jgi:5'-3' exonuclease
MRQPLFDADFLVYQTGFAVKAAWEGEGEPPFDFAATYLDNHISNVCALVEATHPPIMFLTGKTNFRNDIAKRQPYKQRAGDKPFHYYNLRAYIKGKYDYVLQEGIEADDSLSIEQCSRPGDTIIISNDKDLRQCPGWVYSYELGNSPAFGPELVDELGWIKLADNRKKIIGVGGMFFYSQCLTGDVVDSIPGCPKCGPVKAFDILQATTTLDEAYKAVLEAYRAVYEDKAEEELLEQGQLLFMTRKLHPDGSPVLWELPVG